jgi:hypothetical protein
MPIRVIDWREIKILILLLKNLKKTILNSER